MSVNKAILLGRLGQDPELRDAGGSRVCTLSVATTERYTQDGEQKETTTWHRVECWGALAENCAQYLEKGRQVYVEGKIIQDDWTDSDGNDRRTRKVRAYKVDFLSGSGRKQSDPDAGATKHQGAEKSDPRASGGDGQEFEPDSELPF
jgi:single-strand DNA-binding protein